MKKVLKKVGYALACPFLVVIGILDLAYLKWESKQREKGRL